MLIGNIYDSGVGIWKQWPLNSSLHYFPVFVIVNWRYIFIFIYVNVCMMVCPHTSKHPFEIRWFVFISCELPDLKLGTELRSFASLNLATEPSLQPLLSNLISTLFLIICGNSMCNFNLAILSFPIGRMVKPSFYSQESSMFNRGLGICLTFL